MKKLEKTVFDSNAVALFFVGILLNSSFHIVTFIFYM
jgi:hypothetical protein